MPSCLWASPSWSIPISLEAHGPQPPLPVGTPALSLEWLRVAHQADANADLHLGTEAAALGPALGCSFSLTSPSDHAPKLIHGLCPPPRSVLHLPNPAQVTGTQGTVEASIIGGGGRDGQGRDDRHPGQSQLPPPHPAELSQAQGSS